MDDADRAQIEIERAEARYAQARTPRAHGPSRIWCVECGTSIEEARRVAVPGCCRCAECARDFERGRLR